MILDALVSVTIAVFVIFLLLYAENKYLSVQNIQMSKDVKKIGFVLEVLQLLPADANVIFNKDLNYSLDITSKKIILTDDSKDTHENYFNVYDDKYVFDCTDKIEITKIERDSKLEIKSARLLLIKNAGKFECKNDAK